MLHTTSDITKRLLIKSLTTTNVTKNLDPEQCRRQNAAATRALNRPARSVLSVQKADTVLAGQALLLLKRVFIPRRWANLPLMAVLPFIAVITFLLW